MKEVRIVEGICYLFPHKEELHASHPAMKGVWKLCKSMLKDKNSFLAPLLVDDIDRSEHGHKQTVENILQSTIGSSYDSLPWIGPQIIESRFEDYYGKLGCKAFDSLYHKDVMFSLTLLGEKWEWHSVNPLWFKRQQAQMHEMLWKLLLENISLPVVASKGQRTKEELTRSARDAHLSRFYHYWINNDGMLESVTQPVWEGGRIVNKTV